MRQKTFKTLLIAAGTVLTVMAGSVPAWSGFEEGQMCPVMPGRPVKEKFFVDHNGKRIYLCCVPCVKAFKKHPEQYIKNL